PAVELDPGEVADRKRQAALIDAAVGDDHLDRLVEPQEGPFLAPHQTEDVVEQGARVKRDVLELDRAVNCGSFAAVATDREDGLLDRRADAPAPPGRAV